MNRLDRAISYLSPSWGAKRIAYRRAMNAAHSYKGAHGGRLLNNWSASLDSADSAISTDIYDLRYRSRDLNRNNSIAASATDSFCKNIAKAGFRPQSRIDFEAIGITEDQAKRAQDAAEKVYKKWQIRASACGRLSFDEIVDLSVRQIVESGEFLSVRRAIAAKHRPYLLALDVIEPDRLDTPSGRYGDESVAMGIAKNSYGEPATYWIRKTHPGETMQPNRGDGDYIPIAAFDRQGRQNVFHLFHTLRPGQTRGVPLFAPVLDKFKILADYLEAELVAARVSACFAAFIKTDNPYAAAVGRADDTETGGDRLESLEPGIIEYLGANQDIIFSDPKRPGTTFDQFVERIIRMIGSALGLPYELILKDFSKTNYSSARAALLQAYRVFEVWQHMLTQKLCQPVWDILLEEAYLRGEFPAPNFERFKWEYTRAMWIAPGWAWVDPLKEAQANQVAIQMKTKTRAIVCAEQGDDWEEVAEQAARERQTDIALGIDQQTQQMEMMEAQAKTQQGINGNRSQNNSDDE